MRRICFFIVLLLGAPTGAFCQTAGSDSQTLQSLLTEVRGLRQDLQTSLARVQSVQILLARLQSQESAVTRASQRLDYARSKIADLRANTQRVAANIKQMEDAVGTDENSPQQKEIQGALDHLKSELEASTNEEELRQAAESEAEQQLSAEQAKLDTLQSQLDNVLRNMTGAAGGRAQP